MTRAFSKENVGVSLFRAIPPLSSHRSSWQAVERQLVAAPGVDLAITLQKAIDEIISFSPLFVWIANFSRVWLRAVEPQVPCKASPNVIKLVKTRAHSHNTRANPPCRAVSVQHVVTIHRVVDSDSLSKSRLRPDEKILMNSKMTLPEYETPYFAIPRALALPLAAVFSAFALR